jgi:hypothetical protein
MAAPIMPPIVAKIAPTTSIMKRFAMTLRSTRPPINPGSNRPRTESGTSGALSIQRCSTRCWNDPIISRIGNDRMASMTAPKMPAISPPSAPSEIVMATADELWIRYAVMSPPPITQRQQQLAKLMIGSAERTPMKSPPRSAGWRFLEGMRSPWMERSR